MNQQRQKKEQVRQIIARLLKAYGLKDANALAAKLDYSRGTISNWVSFSKIPTDQIFECNAQTGESLDWLTHGQNVPPQWDKDKRTQLLDHINQALLAAVRYKLIEPVREDGIGDLASGLTTGIIDLIDNLFGNSADSTNTSKQTTEIVEEKRAAKAS